MTETFLVSYIQLTPKPFSVNFGEKDVVVVSLTQQPISHDLWGSFGLSFLFRSREERLGFAPANITVGRMMRNLNSVYYFWRKLFITADGGGFSKPQECGMKKYLLLGVLAVLFAVPLSAAENAKINLPDGIYMYDSSIERLTKGGERVGFGKYFVVKNNTIYSSQEAMKKFGVSKLNELFTENKNYKILFGGENIGKIYSVTIDDEGDWNYKEELFAKNIKEGPAYRAEGIYVGRLGSVARHLAVPETYKVLRTISFKDISKEEVDKISKLVKEKLLPLVKNRKELKKNKINEMELAA